ncbi:MAG TPA: restriction endonuclease [Chitinophagales bacterium]|nr:restriction endonuclease [Chitinophagales bacterium]
MPIPDYQTLMLPFLKHLSDGNEHNLKDITEVLANQFKLSEDERSQLLPSGNQQVFNNRIGWVRTHLKFAGLIEVPRRAVFKIGKRGLDVLKQNPKELNNKFLKQFPEYLEFITPNKNQTEQVETNSEIESISSQTPDEVLEASYHTIRNGLASELLSKLKIMNPYRFEKVVVELLVKMGYGGSITEASKAIKKSGDEGIDGVISEDKLGLDIIYIQAKRWENVVGRPELHKFVGALAGQGAKKGIFITTSYFSKDALEYNPKNDTKIVLIDGIKLSDLMIDYNLGVSLQNIYEVKKLDTDYFEED